MPIYEYQCPACHRQFEEMQKINEPPLTQCPHCHSDGVQKLISACGFELKGSGWYATDFKNKPTAKEPSSTASETTKPATSTSTQNEKNTQAASKSSTDSSS